MNTLNSAFDGARFAAEKVAEAVHWDRPNAEAVQHVDYLIDAVGRFRKMLAERGLEDFYGRDVALIEYPLIELRKFLNSEASALDKVTGAYIFARFVNEQIAALQSLAEEIDADNAA